MGPVNAAFISDPQSFISGQQTALSDAIIVAFCFRLQWLAQGLMIFFLSLSPSVSPFNTSFICRLLGRCRLKSEWIL